MKPNHSVAKAASQVNSLDVVANHDKKAMLDRVLYSWKSGSPPMQTEI